MITPINFSFENICFTIRQVEGCFWFDTQPVCQALELLDINDALLNYCRPEGILFGSGEMPLAMIDLENLLRLSMHSTSPRAERLLSWLCQVLLPHLFGSTNNLPSYRQLKTTNTRLRVLKWHDDWWMSMSDVVQVFGTRPELFNLEDEHRCG